MKGLSSDADDKPTNTNGNSSDKLTPPPPRRHYERCIFCPMCNAACHPRTSKTDRNPDRDYYKCAAHPKFFFKWADEVNPDHFIYVPDCGGCGAGTCRVRRDTTGPNAGRILFICRVKEGEGSCGYRVWQDELERIINPSQSTIDSVDISPDLVEEDEEPEAHLVTPMPMINTSQHLKSHEIITPNKMMGQQDKSNDSNYTSHISRITDSTFVVQDPILVSNIESNTLIRSREGVKSDGKPLFDLKKCRNTFDCIPAVQEKIMVNSRDSTTVNGNILEAENYSKPLSSPCHSQNTKLFGAALDVPSLSKAITQNVMPKSISNAFVQAGENLQNVLFNLLETTDVKDHVAMRQAAEATFAALDSLRLGDPDFKNRVNEFIQCASWLSEIEQSMPTNDSYQKLVERCSSERARLEEISCVHAETVDTFTKKKQRLLEEMRNMEVELDEVSRNKEELEGKYLSAHNEVEESKKLFERKEEEAGVAKAAYDRARALLRG